MSDIERLTEALRRANAELEVDPHELADAVSHGRRQLLGRLLAVAALSAVGALLLLSGGLAASQAVKDDPSKGGKEDKSQGKKQHHAGGKHSGEGKRQGSGKSQGNSGNSHHHHHEEKQHARSSIGSGQSPEREEGTKVERQPNLAVVSLSRTGIEVINTGNKLSGPFSVMVTVEPEGERPYEIPVSFAALAPEEAALESFAKELTCEKGGVIVAEIDPEQLVEESEEGDNVDSESCEPPSAGTEKSEEKLRSEESTTSTVPASSAAETP